MGRKPPPFGEITSACRHARVMAELKIPPRLESALCEALVLRGPMEFVPALRASCPYRASQIVCAQARREQVGNEKHRARRSSRTDETVDKFQRPSSRFRFAHDVGEGEKGP